MEKLTQQRIDRDQKQLQEKLISVSGTIFTPAASRPSRTARANATAVGSSP